MDKVRKCYIDNRFGTVDSISDSDYKFEFKEQIDLQGNKVMSKIGQSPTHGEQLKLITTSFTYL